MNSISQIGMPHSRYISNILIEIGKSWKQSGARMAIRNGSIYRFDYSAGKRALKKRADARWYEKIKAKPFQALPFIIFSSFSLFLEKFLPPKSC